MIHHHRTFAVGVVDNLDELVEKLTDRTWTLCTCFAYQGLLLANDSFQKTEPKSTPCTKKVGRSNRSPSRG